MLYAALYALDSVYQCQSVDLLQLLIPHHIVVPRPVRELMRTRPQVRAKNAPYQYVKPDVTLSLTDSMSHSGHIKIRDSWIWQLRNSPRIDGAKL